VVDTTAKIICDSIGPDSPRLTTFLLRYPKFVHAEHCRHRSFSLAVSSSRAIPVSKNLEEARSDELRAGPVYWGAEQKGMSGGEELSDELGDDPYVLRDGSLGSPRAASQERWRRAALYAVSQAECLRDLGVHKSIVNRLLEPFLHVNVLATCAEPGLLNFFGLRLDRAAQPEIRALADAMWRAWNESRPTNLVSGQWHLPFIDSDAEPVDISGAALEMSKRISTARCARLSYQSFETGRRSTIEEDLKLYERLVGSHPIHASPAEHQATPDEILRGNPRFMKDEGKRLGWCHRELHGNLPGWVQHRKTLPGEAVAPLPEGYR
jgi:thymidylate synthase ThyX